MGEGLDRTWSILPPAPAGAAPLPQDGVIDSTSLLMEPSGRQRGGFFRSGASVSYMAPLLFLPPSAFIQHHLAKPEVVLLSRLFFPVPSARELEVAEVARGTGYFFPCTKLMQQRVKRGDNNIISVNMREERERMRILYVSVCMCAYMSVSVSVSVCMCPI
jgi:hypothetical protein